MPPLNRKDGAGSGIPLPMTYGVWGDSTDGDGVIGTSRRGEGVWGHSRKTNGVHGSTDGNESGVLGENPRAGTGVTWTSQAGHGVRGTSGKNTPLAPKSRAGVWGDSSNGSGVYGSSNVAGGVHGQSSRAEGVLGETSSGQERRGVGAQHVPDGDGFWSARGSPILPPLRQLASGE